jgi:stearoyl-CoA 9-desaturase NADPH oxidoreductase
MFTELLETVTSPYGIDRYLELVHPMLTVRELRAEVTAVRRSTSDSVTLTLRPTRQWRGFAAGQFVRVSVDIDGVRRSRCYSPAGSQHRSDGRIELTVKAHLGGLVSRYLHTWARPGLVVGLSQADGAFTLPAVRPSRILLISGGSGITPVLSMLRTLCDEDYPGEVTFLHYASDEAAVPYLAELRSLGAHRNVRVVFGHPAVDGYFGLEQLRTVEPRFAAARTYLCGPPGLMQAVREVYAEQGLSERLHTEEFVPAVPVVADGSATGQVSFARSDVRAPNSGQTLLEQAEGAGLRPEHGCRMGICFSCTQIKLSGCVRNIRSGAVSSEEDEEIQLCVSVPLGSVAIDI